jgi:hypothetical protein
MVDAGGILVVCKDAIGQPNILRRGKGFMGEDEGDILKMRLHCRIYVP